jgi:hypothetical protein
MLTPTAPTYKLGGGGKCNASRDVLAMAVAPTTESCAVAETVDITT